MNFIHPIEPGVGEEINPRRERKAQDLAIACLAGSVQQVRKILGGGFLRRGFEPAKNQRYYYLHHAAYGGNSEIIKLLLEAGMDVNQRDKDGKPPLLAALLSTAIGDEHKLQTAKTLIETGADSLALIQAAFWGDIDGILLLLEAGADPNFIQEGKFTPLSAALSADPNNPMQADICRVLIAAGADATQRIREGRSLLFNLPSAETIRLLVEAGVDPNEPGDYKFEDMARRPLDAAIVDGNAEACAALLTNGADPKKLYTYGPSLMELARDEKLGHVFRPYAFRPALMDLVRPGLSSPDEVDHRRAM